MLESRHRQKNETTYKCKSCEYSTNSKMSINTHLSEKHQVTDRTEWFQCPHCPYNTPRKGDLKRHVSVRHVEHSLNCQKCSFEATTMSVLSKHQTEAHGDSRGLFKCPRCDYCTFQRSYLKQHENRAHKTKIKYTCHICGHVSDSWRWFKEHLLKKHEIENQPKPEPLKQSFDCQKCSFKTGSKSSLLRHQIETHDESRFTMFKCSTCSFNSYRREEVELHELTAHKDKSKYSCEHCEYSTNVKFRFKSHMLKKHQVEGDMEPYKCDKCPYNTLQRSNFMRHVTKHYKVPFVCQKCSFEAEQKATLFRHEIDVHGESSLPTYRCSECDFISCGPEGIRKHERRVHENKIFTCNICEFFSNVKLELTSHLLEDHQIDNEKDPFQCPHCPYNTLLQGNFNRHVKLHDERSLNCQKCSFKADKKSILFRHEIETHGESSFTSHRCSKCDFNSYQHWVVKRHEMTVHERDKARSGSESKKSSDVEGNFNVHLSKKCAVKDGAKNFKKCPHCEFQSFRQTGLDRHLKKQHKEKRKPESVRQESGSKEQDDSDSCS